MDEGDIVVIGGKEYEAINGELVIDRNTAAIKYEDDYLDNYTLLAQTLFSIRLCQWRRAYAETWGLEHDGKYLDYGCGHSPILENIYLGNWREELGEWYGTDCNLLISSLRHMADRWVPPTEVILADYEVVCFFDVIEHLRNYKDILHRIAIGNAIVITVPCWDNWSNTADMVNWRHYKPGEHFIYGSAQGWIKEIERRGFKLIDHTTYESAMGRLDSHTMAFRKVK
jgi:hypothetical protein